MLHRLFDGDIRSQTRGAAASCTVPVTANRVPSVQFCAMRVQAGGRSHPTLSCANSALYRGFG